MTQFSPPLAKRGASRQAGVERRVQVLEQRLNASPAAQTGVIDPAYSSGDPNVTVGADTSLTGPYQYLSGYTPAAADPVALLWVGGTWIVLGKLS